MIVRTVLDLRPNVPKFVLQTVLLAASWHRFVRHSALLEVMHIGNLPSDLAILFDQLGVKVTAVRPNANDRFSKTSNTIQGAEPVAGHQILLVDNDVVFTSGIDNLCSLRPDCVYGAVAGNYRVTQQQWAHIAKIGFHPAACEPQVPRSATVKALSEGRTKTLPPLGFAYPNGGVILFPSGYDFKLTWQKQQREIAAVFDGHRLSSGSVTQSNMAALATTIGTYGTFSWLPPGYNFRHADFALGLCTAPEIGLVHMTGLGKRTEAGALSTWIDEYWSSKMVKGLNMLQQVLPEHDLRHRAKQLSEIHQVISATITTYELDALAMKLVNQVASNRVGERLS